MIKGSKHRPETRAKMASVRRGRFVGVEHPQWRGGRYIHGDGYVLVWSPDHPYKNGRGYVPEHRLAMEAHLGRTLLPTEVVHHINGIKDDNRIENLERFDSNAGHLCWHNKNR